MISLLIVVYNNSHSLSEFVILNMLKRPLHRCPQRRKKFKCHFQAHFPSSIVRKEKDLHGVHCAILSSDSITHQTLQDMRNDPRISKIRTVARQPWRELLSSKQSNARRSKGFSRKSQISAPIIYKQKPFINKVDDDMAHKICFVKKKKYRKNSDLCPR